MRLVIRLIAGLLMVITTPLSAQSLDDRAADLADVLRGNGDEAALFAPSFRANVSPTQVRDLAADLRAQNGDVITVETIRARTPTEGEVQIGYAKSVARFAVTLSPRPPHQIIGLWLTGVSVRGDTADLLAADFAALPGGVGIVVTALGSRQPPLLSVNADAPRAVGSSFKLWLLAETSRQVSNRARNWQDVVPLGPPSLPSGMMQDWPQGTPATLHTLATLAITISDNTASDTLHRSLGRSNVDAMAVLAGASAAAGLPVLTTIEAFALKMARNSDLRTRWRSATTSNRRRVLAEAAARLTIAAIDRTEFAGNPLHIDSAEWFASPADMVRTLDWLRVSASQTARDILAIVPGLPKGTAARFAYVGYKGGSETGVVARNYLLRTRRGDWYGISGAWNNAAGPVDAASFEALVARAINLID